MTASISARNRSRRVTLPLLDHAKLPEEVRHAFSKAVATAGTVRPLDQVERESILAALELNGGNQTRTAGQLGDCIASSRATA
jgi:hypothetical protein